MQSADRATPANLGTITASGPHDRLVAMVHARFDASISATRGFFESEADAVSCAALDMARRFARNGRLLVFGDGADTSDAEHISVEFVHPVIVGKRALPALALTNDVGTLTFHRDRAFATMLAALGRAEDIALGIGESRSAGVAGGLEFAKSMGMLTVSIDSASKEGDSSSFDGHRFVLRSDDPLVVQEVGETLYHVLWELVHVFLEHDVASRESTAVARGAAP